ncbi:hypothetical protein SD10_00365 [Spirosoma radiotolerans]|uniref:Uncharacterized protein n=1 Tax=Spirosoma radiotolerans TaxID=1379870 RepID=A0A0E3ZSM6_9BACT|nr:hypothetical protein SD10_00365 [Spirosoma radiotolerans]
MITASGLQPILAPGETAASSQVPRLYSGLEPFGNTHLPKYNFAPGVYNAPESKYVVRKGRRESPQRVPVEALELLLLP